MPTVNLGRFSLKLVERVLAQGTVTGRRSVSGVMCVLVIVDGRVV